MSFLSWLALLLLAPAASTVAYEEVQVLYWWPQSRTESVSEGELHFRGERLASQAVGERGRWVKGAPGLDPADFEFVATAPQAVVKSDLRVVRTPEELSVFMGDELFTTYHSNDGARPYFHPVHAPGSVPLTRSWPMAESPGETRDHPHHRSLWFSYGDVNGHDLWAEGKGSGAIRSLSITEPVVGEVFAEFSCVNEWCADGGEVLCTDQRVYRFFSLGGRRVIDFEVRLLAGDDAVRLGDTKEGMMALRVAPTLRVEGEVAAGVILNSEGNRGAAAWGKRAAWCDLSGPVQGGHFGIAMFDHPTNLRHPTWWHVRTYGLFAANPFGLHYFEKQPAGAGDHVIPAHGSLSFRYRILIHSGTAEEAQVGSAYERYRGSDA